MAIEQGTYWRPRCDGCGDDEAFASDDYGAYALFDTEKAAREEVPYRDGVIREDGTILCPGCVEEGDGSNGS